MALPFLDAMVPTGLSAQAHAATVKPPKRIVFLLTPGGFHMDKWKCAIPGAEAKDFTLSPILSEFKDIREHCTFIEGVPMSSAVDPRTCASGHPKGTTAVFTGSFAGPGNMFGGGDCKAGAPQFESVDQTLSRFMNGKTRLPSLHVGALVQANLIAKRCFFGPNQTCISPEEDPAVVFRSVFGNFTPGTSAAAEQLLERRFILDAVKADLKALSCKLGGEDRARLDRHATEIGELSVRLGLSSGGMACVKPSAPPVINASSFAQMPQIIKAQMDLVAMALACDLTRVVGFQVHAPDMDSGGIYSFLGHDIVWHKITHKEGKDPLVRYEQTNRWQAQQVLYLAKKLQSLKEADGTSVLDNTVIVWASELGRGWTHDPHDVAWHLIGKGQGYFDTGKYIKFGGTPATRHNRLLVHLLRYMGMNNPGVGHPDYQGDPLPSIAA